MAGMEFKYARVVCRGRWTVSGLLLCSALVFLAQTTVHADQSVTLTWNPSIATNVAGYKIYAGSASHNYSITNVTGIATNTTIASLVQGVTYYFAATMYDGAGNESTLSAEASYTVPVTAAALGTPARAGNQFSFAVAGDAGSQYVVQASTNMMDWVCVRTNTAPFTFVDTNAACFSQRYYRTYYLSP